MSPFFSDPALVRLFPWLAGLLGLLLGSFYSVCAHRYVVGQSIVLPPSHCPDCGHRLSWWELLPILGYVLARGRCVGCGGRISIGYPLLEIVSAAWAALAALKYGPTPLFLVLMAVGGLFIVASAIDLRTFLLPNRLTYPAAVLGVVAGWLTPGVGLQLAAYGAVGGYVVFWLLAVGYRSLRGVEGLGGGDVKLMLSIGGMCGAVGLPMAILMGSVAALACSPAFLWGGKGKKSAIPIPFGPFLCFGAMAQALLGLGAMPKLFP
jgi:leader peptidase (prepilin peptidase)/N-methyltransferase